MKLHQVDVVGLEPPQRFVDLTRRGGLGPAVDLGHEEDLVPVPVFERLAHADFADPVVVVPTVVQEGDSMVDGSADQLSGLLLLERWNADVKAAESDGRYPFPGAAQCAIDHAVALQPLYLPMQHGHQQLLGGGQPGRGCRRSQKVSPVHGIPPDLCWMLFLTETPLRDGGFQPGRVRAPLQFRTTRDGARRLAILTAVQRNSGSAAIRPQASAVLTTPRPLSSATMIAVVTNPPAPDP